jgi:23S rRNA (adenine-N6)-dimethyltransferase
VPFGNDSVTDELHPRPRRQRRRGPRSEQDIRRRTLSQNFMRPSGIDRFMNVVDLDPDLLCLEVGAGEGALTERLAVHCHSLRVYEIDKQVARKLSTRLAHYEHVQLVVGDFLEATAPTETFQVVGNVPYSRTSDIINWCLRAPTLTRGTFTVQLEYAKKRTGSYGRWSRLTILSWPNFSWELLGVIPRYEFSPIPRVDSGVMTIKRRVETLVSADLMASYEDFVKLGFTGVGGSLYATLQRRYPTNRLRVAFKNAALDRATVVAFVTPEQWLKLFSDLYSQNDTGRKRRPRVGNRGGPPRTVRD